MSAHTYIIAEAGVNHNGSFELARVLVDAAKAAGADAVKFQTFKAENLVTKQARQAEYQVANIGEETSQFYMLKRLELSFNEFVQLKNYCDQREIEFLSTPFDKESVDFLLDELKIQTVKIPSGELTNVPFIHYIATKQKPMILSTGMADMEDIHSALAFIAYGLVFPEKEVNVTEVQTFYNEEEAKRILKKYVTVLHCTTEYPVPIEEVNLRAMDYLQHELQVDIGLSDHSEGIYVPISATARGAKVIEKHFTISRMLPGPDHQASLEPHELTEMVKAIRAAEQSLGQAEKKPTKSEQKNRVAARKSLTAACSIKKGEFFSKENLVIKRPGSGMAPAFYWSLLGTEASKDYEAEDLIDE
ncbi:N-acetylneuraminate synthase [Domibacillus indicus]|uniref:N-acetylneuraminate synthase n=1 Tax=Domibacillus indicus TaxID=1437523 RepID=UPI000618318A|nr:N-acetylneuraminate synthase [Domibacillus indicus]